MTAAPKDTICVALRAHGEHWVFFFSPPDRREFVRAAGRWASDSELAFSWEDAVRAVIAAKKQMASD